jgi:hypothetical protein
LVRTAALKTDAARRLTGVEPDPGRRAAAALNADSLPLRQSNLQIDLVPDLDQVDSRSRFDLVMCIQVLGHLTHADARDVMHSLAARRRYPHGIVIVAVPVVANDGVRQMVPWDAPEDSDYYFDVDLSKGPFDPDYSEPLTPEQFDQHVLAATSGRLLVRSFNVGSISATTLASCPAPIDDVPRDLRQAFARLPITGLMYSFHRFSTQTRKVIVGDAMFRIG